LERREGNKGGGNVSNRLEFFLRIPFLQPPIPTSPSPPFTSLTRQEGGYLLHFEHVPFFLNSRRFLLLLTLFYLLFHHLVAANQNAAAISRGVSSSSSASAAANSNSSVHRLNDNSFLFSWAMQAPLALDLIRVTLIILIQQVESDINKTFIFGFNF